MKTINELKKIMPQIGAVEWIGVRPKRKAALQEVKSVKVSMEEGLAGDHNSKKGGKRMVTLIQKEHIDMISALMNKEVKPSDLRRNIVVSGLNLLALSEKEFMIGEDVILRSTGNCVPCSRMEQNLGPGGYNAMRGHGGMTATVIKGGKIELGATVTLKSE